MPKKFGNSPSRPTLLLQRGQGTEISVRRAQTACGHASFENGNDEEQQHRGTADPPLFTDTYYGGAVARE